MEIIRDNGPQFTSVEFSSFIDIHKIKHHRVTPYWPCANSEVERFNRVLKKAIQTAHAEDKDWKDELYNFLLVCRTTTHCTTGETPSKLLMNRQIRTKLPEVVKYKQKGSVRQTDENRKMKIAFQANKKCRLNQLMKASKLEIQ